MINPLSDVSGAVREVKAAKTEEERLDIIKKYLEGAPDPTKEPGKVLLHRRALFCTAIAEEKLWPRNDEGDEQEDLVLV